jgi:hypothetical protein
MGLTLSARTSTGIGGRPRRDGAEPHRQCQANRRQCQETTVAGFTICTGCPYQKLHRPRWGAFDAC